jgi:hypothetical protein
MSPPPPPIEQIPARFKQQGKDSISNKNGKLTKQKGCILDWEEFVAIFWDLP